MPDNAPSAEPDPKLPVLVIAGLVRPGLEPIHLEVGAGECVAVSGPSGAGKSLFLRAVADLDSNAGRVAVDGVARDTVAAPEWRRGVCYVASESGWWAEGVGAHFADPAAATGILARLGLAADALSGPVRRLSTGERQRLALARMPRVLLLDEPTSGLDPDATARVERLLDEHLATGGAIVAVTHDAAQAARLGGRQLRMEAGRLGARDEGRPRP